MTREKKSMETEEEVMPNSIGGVAGKFIFVLLFLVVLVGFGWYFMKYQKAEQQINYLSSAEGRQEVDTQEINKVITDVGRHIILPEGETPTVATIEDAQALASEQAFFIDAQNGDKVLIYSNKAIVYNPGRDILVNVGPVYFQDLEGETQEAIEELQEAESQQEKEEEEVVEVIKMNLDIRNGSQVPGVAQTLANDLSAQGDYSVVSVNNAANTDYTDTVLVNLGSGDVSDLEQSLGVSAVNVLPEGESEGLADVVIIIGNE